jgi:hypothetical protein
MAYLQESSPNYTYRDNLCAIPPKKVEFKVKNQEAIKVIKTIRGSSPNKALSDHAAATTLTRALLLW